jgi:hypothetical protein
MKAQELTLGLARTVISASTDLCLLIPYSSLTDEMLILEFLWEESFFEPKVFYTDEKRDG